MMLGEILTTARKSGAGMESWLAEAEPEIWAALGAASATEDNDVSLVHGGASFLVD